MVGRAMRDPEEFDAFYKDARDRLLVQTFALTGDVRASRSAVRDTFVVAWHHWRKVSRDGGAEAWARPHAWAHAHRRHTARRWHKEKGLEPEELDFYLDFFRYGVPPHGGFGMGLARLLMLLLGESSIREVTFLFRGPTRLAP